MIERVPTARVEVVKVAWPLALNVPVPSKVAPSKKFAVPVVGVPAPGAAALKVAVRVEACPNTDGLVPEITVVVVGSRLTTCVSTGEVLGEKLELPP